MAATGDPYKVLGLSPDAPEDQLRAAYRRLVQANHPDHNNGSPESERRFEEIQEAYLRIRRLRTEHPVADQPRPAAAMDPDLEARLADIERQVRDAHAARERARRAAAQAAAQSAAAAAAGERKGPTDEELGYVHTDDSFAKILADAEEELTERLSGAREHPVGRRVSDLIDELTGKLRGEKPRGSRGRDG